MTTKDIDLDQVYTLIDKYLNAGGEVETAQDGCLGVGTLILQDIQDMKLKEFVIEEYYVNEWTSHHRLKTYTKGIPKKYIKMLEEYTIEWNLKYILNVEDFE